MEADPEVHPPPRRPSRASSEFSKDIFLSKQEISVELKKHSSGEKNDTFSEFYS